ncbi:MAG: nucleotidyl transferase AbiEii/AbiGii toxin family protein [Syntrophaceae bacterium]|nr:nucleotidyl transferase AbiEii/AbiGii toxin family protein [Syntrophaceae bacterium]
MLEGKGTLTPIQGNLLYEIGKIREASFFFLSGGTALAEFYLGHRRSYDLDFFTAEENLLIPFVRRVEKGLPKAQFKVHVIRLLEAFAEVEAQKEGEAIRLHFACDSPFRFEEPQPSGL